MSLFDLTPAEFTALSVLLGFALLPGLNANQQNSLGNFLMAIGQVLETAAAQSAVAPGPDQSGGTDDTQAAALQNRLAQLEARLAALEAQQQPDG